MASAEDTNIAGETSRDDIGTGGVLFLGGVLLLFLLLLAVGAVAFVVGEMAQRQAADGQAATVRPGPGQYGASVRS